MTRVLAVSAVAALLVLGGFWLAQRPDAPPPVAVPTLATPMEVAPPAGYDLLEPQSDTPKRTFDAPQSVLDPALDYAALITTSKGELLVDLYETRTPETVNNFVFLALQRYYDGVPFHRVLEDFMAQTGDPTGTGSGGPGYTFDDEIVDGLSHDRPGLMSMANAGPGTNGSQFFLTFAATPWLDGRHTVFGEVIDGLEVLDALTRIDPQNPSAVLPLDATVAEARAQGVELAGDETQTLGARLEEALGTAPVAGQSFTLDNYRGVVGRAGGQPAVGFFPQPDTMERVSILTRPR